MISPSSRSSLSPHLRSRNNSGDYSCSTESPESTSIIERLTLESAEEAREFEQVVRKLNRNLAALERSNQSLSRSDGPTLVRKLVDGLFEKLSQPPFELHMRLSDANWIHLKLSDSISPDARSNPMTPRPSIQFHIPEFTQIGAPHTPRHPLDVFFEYPLTDFDEAGWKVGDHHVPLLLHALFENVEPLSSTSSSPLPSPSSTLSR